MFEVLVNPKKAQEKPWLLLFVGILYASLSFLIVNFFFSRDVILSRYSGLLMAMFASLFSIIFVYHSIKLDERENLKDKSEIKAILHDWKILSMFLWLFLGFVIAFSFWQIVIPSVANFNSQTETYCVLNNPLQFSSCISSSANLTDTLAEISTIPKGNFLSIFFNNVYVMFLVIIFSLIFGAGSIFIIAWNASIISAVISLSIKFQLSNLHLGLLRFMVHGLPEMAGYFIATLAAGMTSFAVMGFVKKKLSMDNLLKIIQRSAVFLLVGIVLLALAALIEIFITPILF